MRPPASSKHLSSDRLLNPEAYNVYVWEMFVQLIAITILAVGHKILVTPFLKKLTQTQLILDAACAEQNVS